MNHNKHTTHIGQIVHFSMAGYEGVIPAMIIAVVHENLQCDLKLFPNRNHIQNCKEAKWDDAVRLLEGGEAYSVPFMRFNNDDKRPIKMGWSLISDKVN